ncbi:MAG TPA: ABC transporter substrate-binding protein [Thermoanaerobaculia bacterium]|nr:ABC transporter substrate-binding protein [Thermoanaerobaculia bacterium]
MSEQSSVASFRRGVSGSSIRLGVLLPPRDVLPTVSGAVAALLGAYVDELNAEGGVRRRRLDLFFAAPEGTADERAQAMREFVKNERLFALAASFTDGADRELSVAAAELGIPLLATISSKPWSSIAPGKWVRDLCGGVVEQSVALMTAFGARGGGGTVAVLHDDHAAAEAIGRYAGLQAQFADVKTMTAEELRRRDPAAVLLAASGGAAERLLHELSVMQWWPPLLLPGGALPPQLLDRLRPGGGVWIAVPTAAQDQTPEALDAYTALAKRHVLPLGHQISQFAALTSMQLFLDAIRRADDVHQTSLLAAIDATQRFHSGLFAPLTYGPRRHIGSSGAWIFALHEGTAPQWVEVESGATSRARV